MVGTFGAVMLGVVEKWRSGASLLLLGCLCGSCHGREVRSVDACLDAVGESAPAAALEIDRQHAALRSIAERYCAMWEQCSERNNVEDGYSAPADPRLRDLYWSMCPSRIVHGTASALASAVREGTGAWSTSGEACLDREFESCDDWNTAIVECDLITWVDRE